MPSKKPSCQDLSSCITYITFPDNIITAVAPTQQPYTRCLKVSGRLEVVADWICVPNKRSRKWCVTSTYYPGFSSRSLTLMSDLVGAHCWDMLPHVWWSISVRIRVVKEGSTDGAHVMQNRSYKLCSHFSSVCNPPSYSHWISLTQT